MVGGTCRGAAVFSLYFQRRPGGKEMMRTERNYFEIVELRTPETP
jgi:hypothetical protein